MMIHRSLHPSVHPSPFPPFVLAVTPAHTRTRVRLSHMACENGEKTLESHLIEIEGLFPSPKLEELQLLPSQANRLCSSPIHFAALPVRPRFLGLP